MEVIYFVLVVVLWLWDFLAANTATIVWSLAILGAGYFIQRVNEVFRGLHVEIRKVAEEVAAAREDLVELHRLVELSIDDRDDDAFDFELAHGPRGRRA
ncbi:MAG: hypothetical protein HYU51_15950 [Candidatus Rokubacteria bacterium]|nr:hypothetical protein [Candidatus Rokubacteria bacterium]